MGKGDKKTRRGKLFQGSFGVRRPKKSTKSVPPPPVSKPVEIAVEKAVEKPVKAVKEIKEKEPAPVKAPKAATGAKKEPKAKKQADSATRDGAKKEI